MTSAKNDIAALQLSRCLDVKWDTAWLIKQKLMEVMRQRNATYELDGLIQVDDAYIGGEKPGKPGRGAANKLPFVAAAGRKICSSCGSISPSATSRAPSPSPAPAARSMRATCRVISPPPTNAETHG